MDWFEDYVSPPPHASGLIIWSNGQASRLPVWINSETFTSTSPSPSSHSFASLHCNPYWSFEAGYETRYFSSQAYIPSSVVLLGCSSKPPIILEYRNPYELYRLGTVHYRLDGVHRIHVTVSRLFWPLVLYTWKLSKGISVILHCIER